MRIALLVLAISASLGCSKSSSTPAAPDASPVLAANSIATIPLMASASAAPTLDARTKGSGSGDAGPVDFEDEFQYGDYDAGPVDPSALTKTPGFMPYANGRFGFSLEVPKTLVAMLPPDNGDGMQWRLGNLVVITASGMNWMREFGNAPCATSKNVTSHTETPTGCFATGTKDGFIFWERQVISRGVNFSLRFEYVESMKAQMDPVVKHVNASWKF